MKKYAVGVVGATGMVGQRFVTLLERHPWFQLTVVAASARSAGKPYEEAVGHRWAMPPPFRKRPNPWWFWMPRRIRKRLPMQWTLFSVRWT